MTHIYIHTYMATYMHMLLLCFSLPPSLPPSLPLSLSVPPTSPTLPLYSFNFFRNTSKAFCLTFVCLCHVSNTQVVLLPNFCVTVIKALHRVDGFDVITLLEQEKIREYEWKWVGWLKGLYGIVPIYAGSARRGIRGWDKGGIEVGAYDP
jgi:hypothetical protein